MPDGTEIVATLDNRLSTQEARAEDPFTLTIVSPGQFQGAQIDGRLLAWIARAVWPGART